jgi:hypothetical protein
MSNQKKNTHKSTVEFLKFSEVRNDVLLVDNSTFCAIVAISSTNYALKNQEEQDALIYGYQSFLNALDFPIQILVRSRKFDIHIYLEKVKKMMEQHTNELLRIQTGEYIEFISKLVENASIMNKNFYIVIPHYVLGAPTKKAGGLFSIFSKPDPKKVAAEKFESFEAERMKLDQKVSTILSGLSGLGLSAMQLKTGEIIELMYSSYNFGAGPLIDAGMLDNMKLTDKS